MTERKPSGMSCESWIQGQIRDILETLNARIRRVNSTVTVGPSTTIAVLDVEAVVAAWRRGLSRPAPR